jgi:hypothetical protein
MSNPLIINGNCKHSGFRSAVQMQRVEDSFDTYIARVNIVCRECNAPFFFLMPEGNGLHRAESAENHTIGCLPLSSNPPRI